MNPWFLLAITCLGSYLLGAIPFGYLVGRWRGVDIFQHGSGNIGATNVARVLGRPFGVLVFTIDFLKGAGPVLLAGWLKSFSDADWIHLGWLEVAAGLAAVLGHLLPVYLRFRGGKGVATGAGAVAVLVPLPALGGFLAWLVVASTTRYISLASMAAVIVLLLLQAARSFEFQGIDPRLGFCLLAGALILFRHRSNAQRLIQGTENRLPETGSMQTLAKVLHVLTLGLWFGMTIFFTFVVALSLFHTFETLGQQPERPAFFPPAQDFQLVDRWVNGPKEQGARLAGLAVGPMFAWYFLLQGILALIALLTALTWVRRPGTRVHRWRANILFLALLTVLFGWPIESHVSQLRSPRNQAMDFYLENPTEETRQAYLSARSEFSRWHVYSLLLNFGTVILVSVGMGLAARLPEDLKSKQAT